MRSKITGRTPTQEAKAVAMQAVYNAHDTLRSYLYADESRAFERQTCEALAKLYNRMLDESGEAGLPLPEKVKA